jgi:hypothetical protein
MPTVRARLVTAAMIWLRLAALLALIWLLFALYTAIS